MEHGLARVERENHRADVIVDWPEKPNAMTEAVMADLTEAFRTIDATSEVRAATLLGEGSVFCAGMDPETASGSILPDESHRDAFPRLLDAIESRRVPDRRRNRTGRSGRGVRPHLPV